MALELHDGNSFDGSIGNGNSEQVAVSVASANFVEILVDDGSGGAPGSYDLTVEQYSTAVDGYMQADSVSGSTAFSPGVSKDARGQLYRVTLTNQSGSPTNFRISLEAFADI